MRIGLGGQPCYYLHFYVYYFYSRHRLGRPRPRPMPAQSWLRRVAESQETDGTSEIFSYENRVRGATLLLLALLCLRLLQPLQERNMRKCMGLIFSYEPRVRGLALLLLALLFLLLG